MMREPLLFAPLFVFWCGKLVFANPSFVWELDSLICLSLAFDSISLDFSVWQKGILIATLSSRDYFHEYVFQRQCKVLRRLPATMDIYLVCITLPLSCVYILMHIS